MPRNPLSTLSIHPACNADLPAILRIQSRCYTAIVPESAQSMGAKLAASPATCFVAQRAGDVIAYLLALPWRFDHPPHLDAPDCVLPDAPDTLYLHDLAVDPTARGSGASQALVKAFLTALTESGIGRASLIAIQGSAPWWEGHGFRAALTTPTLDARLAGYGSDVRYMSRQSDTARSS